MTTALPALADGKGRAARERFEVALQELEAVLLMAGSPLVIGNELIKKNTRIAVFKLEGLCRLYQEHDAKFFKPWRKTFKELEDLVGRYGDVIKHLEFAEDKAVDAPKKVIAYLTAERGRLQAELSTFLVDGKWTDEKKSPIAAFRRGLVEDVEWLSYGKDREYIAGQLNEQLKVLKEQYDMNDVNGGLHEFRRQARWFLIYVQALNGLVVLPQQNNPLPGWLAEKYATNLYVTTVQPNYLEVEPIYLPKSLFVWLTARVEELGVVKDWAEAMYGWLPEALLKSGHREDEEAALEKAAKLTAKRRGFFPPLPKALELYAEIQGANLEMLRQAVKGRWPECADDVADAPAPTDEKKAKRK